MFVMLIIALHLGKGITQSSENKVDFDKEYLGVVFEPYTKYHSDLYDYTMTEVEDMLEVLSKRFKWVSTSGMGTIRATSKWNDGWASGFTAAAASHINERNHSRQLVVNVGTQFSSDDRITRQEIENAFSVAEVANGNNLGTVNGIIITSNNTNTVGQIREVAKLLKDNAMRAQGSSLQLGVRSKNCGNLSDALSSANSTFHDPMLEMLEFLDFIVCEGYPNFKDDGHSVSSELGSVTNFFLQVKREFLEVKPNLVVIGQTLWPSFDTKNARFDTLKSVKFWLGMGDWARINKFRVDMYSAFDQPWFLHAYRPHYGWWKRIKNDTSDFDAFQEKYYYTIPAEITLPFLSDHTFKIVFVIFGFVVFLALLGGLLFLYRIFIMVKNQRLTPADINAFENGLKSYLGADDEAEDATKLPYDKSYEIPRTKLIIDTRNLLGSGAFGIVYKGNIQGRPDDVALKMTQSNSTAMNLKSLLSEIKIMIYVGKHQNVVSIIGACTEGIRKGVIIIATEFCVGGSLLGRLREYNAKLSQQPDSNIDSVQDVNVKINVTDNDTFTRTRNCIQWSFEISLGMEYIASKNIIHADLAARNVLLTANGTAKIADFGLSRHLYEYANYVKQNQEPLPWRWMAIESLKNMTFSTKSDVWSYAVTLFEIFSLGDTPYPGLSWRVDFANNLQKGLRMKKPNFATAEIYLTMCDCWNLDPAERPSFTSLASFFNSLLYETTYEIQ